MVVFFTSGSFATDVWDHQMRDLRCLRISSQPGLLGAKPAGPLLQAELLKVFGCIAGALSSPKCVCRPGQTVAAEDLVLLENSAVAEVWLHCKLVAGEHWTLLSVWKPLGRNTFEPQQDPKFVPTGRGAQTKGGPARCGGGVKRLRATCALQTHTKSCVHMLIY